MKIPPVILDLFCPFHYITLFSVYQIWEGGSYDLNEYKTDAFEDWKWTDEGEKFHCYQRKGQIQLFYDPVGDSHLYFGYILAHGDEYECPTEVISLKDVCEVRDLVEAKVKELWELGVIDKECRNHVGYKIIAFEECS